MFRKSMGPLPWWTMRVSKSLHSYTPWTGRKGTGKGFPEVSICVHKHFWSVVSEDITCLSFLIHNFSTVMCRSADSRDTVPNWSDVSLKSVVLLHSGCRKTPWFSSTNNYRLSSSQVSTWPSFGNPSLLRSETDRLYRWHHSHSTVSVILTPVWHVPKIETNWLWMYSVSLVPRLNVSQGIPNLSTTGCPWRVNLVLLKENPGGSETCSWRIST